MSVCTTCSSSRVCDCWSITAPTDRAASIIRASAGAKPTFTSKGRSSNRNRLIRIPARESLRAGSRVGAEFERRFLILHENSRFVLLSGEWQGILTSFQISGTAIVLTTRSPMKTLHAVVGGCALGLALATAAAAGSFQESMSKCLVQNANTKDSA